MRFSPTLENNLKFKNLIFSQKDANLAQMQKITERQNLITKSDHSLNLSITGIN